MPKITETKKDIQITTGEDADDFQIKTISKMQSVKSSKSSSIAGIGKSNIDYGNVTAKNLSSDNNHLISERCKLMFIYM